MSEHPFGYSEHLQENIRDIFMWLCQDVLFLQATWDFFSDLFSEKQNTDLLSELALSSFNIIFESLRNDMTMAISRLSDPPKTTGHYNLSMATLVSRCKNIEGLENLLTQFQSACEPITKRRNKRVGHRDLDTAFKPLENPLPGISKDQINLILSLAAKILNMVLGNYEGAELYFHIASRGGAKQLIYWLKEGKKSRSPGYRLEPDV